ncbi:hypothetical protein CA236_17470 [Sphingomonas sp. ABOLG]|nr:hypothetical protein CA236_17470 [Sphingomonas sp. ABOLG]
MSVADTDYFRSRAEAELKMARAAQDPAALRAHYTLAGHYLDRAFSSADGHQVSAEQIRAELQRLRS